MTTPPDTATEALTDAPMQNQLRVYDDETMRSITRHAEELGYLKAQAECGKQIADLRAQVERMLCEDCPRVGYPTDETRCKSCPRRKAAAVMGEKL